ncbi:MAG: anaerobic carbon-monoxide dehydrogenase catalytic subunit [Candidatus Korarchaeota archaeon NZ13-K]|nr:MAG: anaerobic carbon-monoxide dehydrogenase catalytic subunit [Candidatus Korarchaeota archaeon NZ13-K]
MEKAERDGVETAWHRYLAQQPQCGFGLLGVCCRNCNMGPCRIDPFGYGPSKGICGASADTIVARNLMRALAAGAAAHSDHARDIVEVFRGIIDGWAKDYGITDEGKLINMAKALGIETEGKGIMEIAKEVVEIAEMEFGKPGNEPLRFLNAYAPEKRKRLWERLGMTPRAIDREVTEIMHRTHMGVDADPLNLIAQGIRAALADGWSGSMMATLFSDVMFGTPKPIKVWANLGVLREDAVNIMVHGHNPLLSMKIVEAAKDPELVELARSLGAEGGINVVGMCCTGNEVLMRLGIPIAGNFLQQELAIITGALEAVVVDYQCIMPSLVDVASCYHTKVITTEPKTKIPGAIHVEFDKARAEESAKKIVRMAVENFKNRMRERVLIPKEKMEAVVGFSVEAILSALGGTLEPLAEALRSGKIKGIAGIVGCTNPKVRHDSSHVTITKELIANDILVVGTGCWAIAMSKHGLFKPEAAELAGPGLREVCKALGIPPALHMGSCVDCSRMLVALAALADHLGVDISDLPAAGSAPEWYSEKAVSIGTYFVASGLLVHLGTVPPVLGAPKVVEILTRGAEDLVGGKFLVETDPQKAARAIIDHIMEKRRRLGWPE